MEHRWSNRRSMNGEATLSHPRYGLIRGVVRDISIGGMFVETDSVELPVNTPLIVSFQLHNGSQSDHYRLHAIVVRASDEGAALMYLDSSVDTVRPLRQMLYGPPGETVDALPVWPNADNTVTVDVTGHVH